MVFSSKFRSTRINVTEQLWQMTSVRERRAKLWCITCMCVKFHATNGTPINNNGCSPTARSNLLKSAVL